MEQTAARADDRAYPWLAALLAAAGLYACWAMLPLAWDGSWQFVDTLIRGRPYTYFARVHTWPMWWPTVWLAHLTSNTRVLLVAFGGPFILAPAAALLWCWFLARREAPGALRWAAVGIAVGALPGQVFLISDTILMNHLIWPVLVGAVVPLTWRRGLPLLIPATVQFIHLNGLFYLAGAAIAAVVVGVLKPGALRHQLVKAALLLAVFGLAAAKMRAFPDAQVGVEASPMELLKRWHNGVEGRPLWGMIGFWVAAGCGAVATWRVANPAGRRWLWRAAALSAAVGCGIWLSWAAFPVHWRLAIDYRRYVLPLTLPFYAMATFAAAVPARRPTGDGPDAPPAPSRARSALPAIACAAFALVLGVQSTLWLGMVRRLQADVAARPAAVATIDDVPWVRGTALEHWTLTSVHIAAGGPVQHKLLAWDPAWAEGLHQTPANVPVVDPAWFAYEPAPGPLGFYDFRPLVEAARAERAERARAATATTRPGR
ncbi:MAG TPA: hypothetical protein VF796_25580 [Humisphaera sp.]